MLRKKLCPKKIEVGKERKKMKQELSKTMNFGVKPKMANRKCLKKSD